MSSVAGLEFYRKLFGSPTTRRGSLDRSSLPSPAAYLTSMGLVTKQPRGKWAQMACPSHKGGDESNASMGVNVVDGHFRCHACGAKGGDIVALHRLRTGLSFRDAVADLGGRFHE